MYVVVLHTPSPQVTTEPTKFWDMVKSWGSTWMWDNLRIMGDISWIAESIADNSLLTVTDGSYMMELYPSLNSAAFVFECTNGHGQLMGSFVKHTRDACSYCGELLGLMAIHLILLAVNMCNPDLPGSVQVFSNCLGALNKIENLPLIAFHPSLATQISLKISWSTAVIYPSTRSTPMLRPTRTTTFNMETSHGQHS